MSLLVTAGQRGDSPQFQPVLEKIRFSETAPRVLGRADRAAVDDLPVVGQGPVEPGRVVGSGL